MENQDSANVMPGVLFREIHKNAFLKRHWTEKRAGFPRRAERVWAVFCVHDDTEPFLELYPDHKIALAHKPDWFVSLHSALHVSPSICGQAEEFEFAITLPTQVVRLAAPSWDSMMEWVETVRNKLRELRVLAPKENLYTKMPEPRHALLPTRDPTSPLPLPPMVPAGIVPGVETPSRPATVLTAPSEGHMGSSELVPRQGQQRNGITGNSRAETNQLQHSARSRVETAQSTPNRLESTPTSSETNVLSNSSRETPHSSRTENTQQVFPSRSENSEPVRRESVPVQGAATSSNDNEHSLGLSKIEIHHFGVDRRKEKPGSSSSGCRSVLVVNEEDSSRPTPSRRTGLDVVKSPSNQEPIIVTSPESNEAGIRRLVRAASVPSATNVTVIEVPPASPHYEHLFNPSEDRPPQESRSKLEKVSSSGLIPRVPARREGEPKVLQLQSPPRGRDRVANTSQGDLTPATASVSAVNAALRPKEPTPQHTSVVTVVGRERAPSPPQETPTQTSVVRVGSSNFSLEVPGPSRVTSTQIVNPLSSDIPPITAAFQPAPAGLDVRDIPLIGGHQRRRRRSSSSDATPVPRGLVGADLIRLTPAEAPETQAEAPRRTLREAQVCQLRREMGHPGGVRLPLRRKDCVGAIALVDISNVVWVAGWKQREHPMLYNALHIGDQVLSIGDVVVRNAGEAQKMLRGAAGPTVELVVRRLPLGVVLALQRPRGGGDVGLVPDPNSAAEVTVVPGGAASRGGLPPRTATMDGLSLTTWTLTEINGRPLSLFCKPCDVASRLNSVGKELSVLVQPSDFIKQLRKQLKAIRGYKEYLLM